MKKFFKKFDEKFIDLLNNKISNKFLDKFMYRFTHLGGVVFTTCFTLLLILLGKGKPRFIGLQMALTLIISQSITYGLKALLSRERPYNILENLKTFNIILKDHSFPSGHTSASFAIATTLAFNMPQIAIFVYLFAFAIGISRIYLGVHYPTDVSAGIFVGVVSAYLVHLFFLNYIDKIMEILI